MATMVTQTCWCGNKFEARLADVKRGWGKSCCKKHAAQARKNTPRSVDRREPEPDYIRQDRTLHEGMSGLDHDWSPF